MTRYEPFNPRKYVFNPIGSLKWYFYCDDTSHHRHGPYKTREEAVKACARYQRKVRHG